MKTLALLLASMVAPFAGKAAAPCCCGPTCACEACACACDDCTCGCQGGDACNCEQCGCQAAGCCAK